MYNDLRENMLRMWIPVLGMHRSGTSAIAGVLQTLGLHFGDSEQAIPVTTANPKGYWERQDVMAVNDAILEKLGCQWDRLHAYRPAAVEEFRNPDLESRIRDILAPLARPPAGFLKDPRLCLTLPIWERVAQPVAALWVIRNPLAVARSLEARGDCSLPVGLAMWELYNRVLALRLRTRPHILVDFDDFQQNPVAGARRLVQQLQAAGVNLHHDGDFTHLKQWFDQDLVRQRPGDEDVSLVPDALRTWYRSLRDPSSVPEPAPYQLSTLSQYLLSYHDTKVRRDEEALRATTHERNVLTWELRKAHDRLQRLSAAQQAFLDSPMWQWGERAHRMWSRLTGRPGAKHPMDKVRDILREPDSTPGSD